jgi:cation diffusion facilitator family transporter
MKEELQAVSNEAIHEQTVKRVTWVSLAVNLGLAAVKFIGGVAGSSQAVVADAVHSLSDVSTDLAILIGIRYWMKPADDGHPHGHRRLETFVTLSIGLILAGVATGILWNGLKTLHNRPETSPGWIALIAAGLSILVKESLFRWTLAKGRLVQSSPLIANAWHHRSDALSSVPALLAVSGAMISPAWSFLDQLGAVVVSLFIYQAAFKIANPAFQKLIDSSAPPETVARIRSLACETPGVDSVHNIRTRYSGCSCLEVDLHIEVDGQLSVEVGHEISEQVKERLIQSNLNVHDVVVHLEPS